MATKGLRYRRPAAIVIALGMIDFARFLYDHDYEQTAKGIVIVAGGFLGMQVFHLLEFCWTAAVKKIWPA